MYLYSIVIVYALKHYPKVREGNKPEERGSGREGRRQGTSVEVAGLRKQLAL